MSYPPNFGYPTGQVPPPGQGGYPTQPGGYPPPQAGGLPPPGSYPLPPGGFAPTPPGCVPPSSAPCGNYFFIKSQMNGLVLDVDGGVASNGRRVMTFTQKYTNADNQLWYEDQATGTIRSKLDPNMCLTFNGTEMIIKDYQAGKQQQHLAHCGDKIHFRHNQNKVLDLADSRREPLAKVVMYRDNGGVNQRWVLEAAGSASAFPPAPGPVPSPGGGSHHGVHGQHGHQGSQGHYGQHAHGQHGHGQHGHEQHGHGQHAHVHQHCWLKEKRHGPPADAVCFGHQRDGGGRYYSAVAHTGHGDIPGKAKGDTCWYPYGGKEHTAQHFSWICATPGRTSLMENHRHSPRPSNALIVGKQNDGGGGGILSLFFGTGGHAEKYSAAIAHTRHGEIPGKARHHTCWYPYGGKEETTERFSWLTVN